MKIENERVTWERFQINSGNHQTLPVLSQSRRILHQTKGTDVEIAQAELAYQEFDSFPHLHVVPHFLVKGRLRRWEWPSPIFVSERIEGKNLEELNLTPGQMSTAKRNLSQFTTSLVDYMSYKFKNGGPYPKDMTVYQFLYGRLPQDEEDKVYMVDVENKISHFDPKKGDPEDFFLVAMATLPAEMIGHLEKVLRRGWFVGSRERYLAFLEEVEQRHLLNSRLEKARGFLLGECSFKQFCGR